GRVLENIIQHEFVVVSWMRDNLHARRLNRYERQPVLYHFNFKFLEDLLDILLIIAKFFDFRSGADIGEIAMLANLLLKVGKAFFTNLHLFAEKVSGVATFRFTYDWNHHLTRHISPHQQDVRFEHRGGVQELSPT